MANPRTSSLDKIIGANLNRYRTCAGLSREALGVQCGVTFQQIAKYEHGTNRISSSKLVEMAGILGVTMAQMVEGAYSSRQAQKPFNKADLSMMRDYSELPNEMRATLRELVGAIVKELTGKMGAK